MKYDAAWEKISFLGRIVGELSGKRIEQRAKQDSVNKLKRNLKEMTDSDEQLQDMLEQYQDRVQQLQEQSNEEKRHYHELMKELQHGREGLSSKEREYGSYEAQKQNYERQVENREQLVKETARKHNIRGFDFDIDDEQVNTFLERIIKMAREQTAIFERTRRETQQELQRVQTVLNSINEQKSALNQKKEGARASIAANDRRISSFQSELDRIEVDEGGKAMLELSIEDTEAKLKAAKSDLETKDWDKQVEQTDASLRALDDQKEKLDTELVQATRQAGDSARLDFLHKEVKDREVSRDKMVSIHGDKISKIVGNGWQPPSLEREFQVSLDESSRNLAEAERLRDGTNRELDQVKYRLNNYTSDLKTKKKELTSCEKTICDTMGEGEPSEYPELLKTIEAARDTTKSDAEYSANLKQFWTESLATAKDKKCCRMCQRFFDGSRDRQGLEKFQNYLQSLIENAGKNNSASELQELEGNLQDLRAISTTYDSWERLKNNDIPSIETEEGRLRSRYNSLTKQVDEEEQTVAERLDTKRDIESLSKTVQNIAKYAADLNAFEQQIEELATKQKSQGLSRGLEAIQDDLKSVNERSRSMKVALTRIIGDRDGARGVINTLELEARDNKSKLSTATYQLKEKASLEKQINELKTQNNEHRDSQRSTDVELQRQGPEMEKAQANYDDIARRGAEKDRQLQRETSEMNNSVNKLQTANSDINDYVDRGGPSQLARAAAAIDKMKQDIKRVEADMNAITVKVKKFENDLHDVEETKRQIADNQDYRRDLAAVKDIAAEIRELESHNAEADKDRYEREGNRWEMERNKLVAEQASIMGQLKSKDDQLQQLIADWETEYKNAGYKYKEAHIKVETTKAAVEDLGRYGGALDKAIMKYHTLKMEEINRIIEELWRKTYQGTDVDSILIRSDNEEAKGNKSYNYRVCMVKQDAEMDMRGRCSAGQKVLASIIIRLALAECFGVNCGLIALDEPTTNLDRDNIRALAGSLAEIIRIRRQQSNFQLIVITHDEDFLRYMQCADFCDYYYRVSRNEKQKSIIVKQSIAEVL